MCIQQKIEAKIEKEKKEKREIRNLPIEEQWQQQRGCNGSKFQSMKETQASLEWLLKEKKKNLGGIKV